MMLNSSCPAAQVRWEDAGAARLPELGDTFTFMALARAMPQDIKHARALLEIPFLRAGSKVKKKKDVNEINSWILYRYARPAVRELLLEMARMVCSTHSMFPVADPDPEATLAGLAATMPFIDLACLTYLHGAPEYIEILECNYAEALEEATHSAIYQHAQLFLASVYARYNQTQKSPRTKEAKLRQLERSQQEMRCLLRNFQNKLYRAQHNTRFLKEQLRETNRTSEELLDEALEYIAQLERRLAEEHKTYQLIIAEYARRLKHPERNTESPLSGKVVVVIGDEAHQTGYRQVIEAYQAEARFCSGFEPSAKLKSAVLGADLVIYITSRMQHRTQEAAESVRRPEVPVIQVHTAGIASFHRAVKQYVEEALQMEECGLRMAE